MTAFRRLLTSPPDWLSLALAKAAPRRFIDAQPSAFGAWSDVADQESADLIWNEHNERNL